MSRSVRRRGRYGAAEKGAKIRSRWGWRCHGKGGGAAPEGSESRGVAPGIACVPPKRGEQGKLCGGCFGRPRTWECRCRWRAEREEYSAGTPAGKHLFALLLPEASGGDIPGHLRPWGHGAEALIFPRRRSALAAESRPRRGGAAREGGCGKSGNSAHPKRRASEGVAAAQGRGVRRGGRAGACVPGAKNRSLRKSAAARGRGAAGRVSPEGGRPAED